MKYCEHCGTQLLDEAVICSKCGCGVVAVRPVNIVQTQDYKYCKHCGQQVLREAVMCPACKGDLGLQKEISSGKILQILAKIFMILGAVACVIIAIFFLVSGIVLKNVDSIADLISQSHVAFDIALLYDINVDLLANICLVCSVGVLLPLFYVIPMIVHYFKSTKNKKPLSTAFKICTLMFVNMIAGILMICDNDEVK